MQTIVTGSPPPVIPLITLSGARYPAQPLKNRSTLPSLPEKSIAKAYRPAPIAGNITSISPSSSQLHTMAAPSPSKRPTNDPLPLFFSPVTLSIHLITRRVSRPATKLTLHSLPTCSFLLMYTLSHAPLTHPSCDLSTFHPPLFSDFFVIFFQWGPHTHTRTHKHLGVPTPTPTPTPWVSTSRPHNACHTRATRRHHTRHAQASHAPRTNATIQSIAS